MGYFDCNTNCQGGPGPDAGPGGVPDPCPGYAVPDICEVCSNMTVECAHAVLVGGVCQVEICPPDGVVFAGGTL